MKKWVIFEFGNGSFKKGFPVTVRIGTDGIEGSTRIPDGFLPPAPSSLTEITLEEWRQRFEEWINFFANRAIKVKPQINTVGNFQDQTQNLRSDVKEWLNSKDEKWDKIIIKNLLIKLNQTDEIRIIIQTNNPNLRRLPWQVWDLFIEHFHKTEFAFSPSQQKVVGVTASPQKSEKVKILVILGEPLEEGQDKKINYQSDIDAINKLGANADFLPQPTRQELINKLWENPWQIIFYSGHSSSEIDGSKGYLQLTKTEIITIDYLKESLRESITKGLQLAIFNSCQGLGLAKQLEDLALPQVIVMREKVPDFVAQMFLQDFLTAFAGGDGQRYLHDALREARKKIHDKYKDVYPGISWLPVICQQYADGKPLIFNNLRQTPHGDGDDELLKLLRELIQAERARKFQLVIQLGEKLLKRYPQNKIARIKTTFAYIQRILNYYNQGKYDEAIQDCDRAILLTPENAEVYYQYARAYHQKNEWEKVIENCTQAIRLKKESDYYWQRGLAYFNQSNYDQAIKDAKSAISLNRKKPDYHYLLGLSYYKKGLPIMLKAKDKIFGLDDQEKYNQAIQLYNQGINALNDAIKINPDKVANYYWIRGLCHLGTAKSDQAIDDFNKANKLEPKSKNYDYNYLLGLSYFHKKDYGFAIPYLSLAVVSLYESKNGDYYYYLSNSYYNRDYSAERSYTESNNFLKTFPEFKKICSQRPESDDQKAKEAIEKAIEIGGYQLEYLSLKNKIEERIKQRMLGGR